MHEPHDIPSSAALHRLIAEARDHQRLPELKVSADSIFAAYLARKQRRRSNLRWAGVGLVACVACVSLGLSLEGPQLRSENELLAATRGGHEPADHPGPAHNPSPTLPEATAPPTRSTPLRLAVGVSIEPLEPHARAPELLGTHAVRLGPGTFRVALGEDDPEDSLRITTASETIDLHVGVITLAVAADRVDVIALQGSASWIREDGTQPIQALPELTDATEEDDAERTTPPSAEELASRAEEHLARGQRAAAIRHLRRLVATYPRSPAALRALLDLGRLERAAGDPNAARCAYRLYLEREREGPLTAEITGILERLGDGPACRGLRPLP